MATVNKFIRVWSPEASCLGPHPRMISADTGSEGERPIKEVIGMWALD